MIRILPLIFVLALCCPVLASSNAAVLQTIEQAERDEIPEGRLEAARKQLKAATKTSADSGRLRMALGLIEMRLGNGGTARDHARKAVKMIPNDAQAHYHRGVICLATVQDAMMINMLAIASAAEESFERAIELRPDYLEAHIALAQYQMGRAMFMPGGGGGMDKARQSANLLLTLEGGELDGRIILASIAAQQEDWTGALQEIDKAIEAADDEQGIARAVTTAFTLAFFVLEDMATVIDLAENRFAERIADSGDTANWVVGRAYADTGRHEDAVAQFRRVLETNPEARTSKFYIAESLVELGETAEARTWYQRYINENPKGDLTKQAKKALKKLK